jgi:hypothetical protein
MFVLHRFLLLSMLVGMPAHATDLPVEGGPGGGDFRSDCSGDFVAGFFLRSGSWVDAIGLKCASLDPATGKFSRPAWNKPYYGGNGGGPQESVCPDDSYVSGIKFGYTGTGTDIHYVDYVEFVCTPVQGGLPHPGICLQTENGCWDINPDKPGSGPFNRPPFEQSCPEGEAAIGIRGRYGSYVDALGLICGPKPEFPTTQSTQPKPVRHLGKARIVTALDDVDIYDGPGGQFQVIGTMTAGQKAVFLQYNQDGWCKLDHLEALGGGPGVSGWVASDHLSYLLGGQEIKGCSP